MTQLVIVTAVSSSLTDPFDDASIDPVKWLQSGAAFTETTDLHYAIVGGTPAYAVLSSLSHYSLISSSVLVEAVEVPNPATDAEMFIRVEKAATDYVALNYRHGNLIPEKRVANVRTQFPAIAYDAVEHRFWRMHEALGTTYWTASADGHTWDLLYQEANPINLSDVALVLSAGNYQAETAPGTARFSNFNIADAPDLSPQVPLIAVSRTGAAY